METCPQNQNRQQKATKKHFSVIFSLICPILDLWKVVDIKSNENQKKRQMASESKENQQKAQVDIGAGETKTGNKKPTPASKETKLQQKAFFFPIFIHLLHFWTLTSRAIEIRKSDKGHRKAMKINKKQRTATKNKDGHWCWRNQNRQQKAKTGNKTRTSDYQ